MSRKFHVVPIDVDKPGDAERLLHEATVYGTWTDGDIVVGRKRPHIPSGEDPAPVNRECARRFVAWRRDGAWLIGEVEPSDVTPFVDVAALMREADERANAAQRGNKKPSK